MKASVLAIGTELTTGQIVNQNAAWLSQQLSKIGIIVSQHCSVPDDKNLILSALNFLSLHSNLIFVTGGLGPTSDDITRSVLSEWVNVNLSFNSQNWQKIQEKLIDRGLTPLENHKQESYFPEGSHILGNSYGTADGFLLQTSSLELYALPGPPKELQAIWQDHIYPSLSLRTKDIDPIITLSWDTIGLPESELADKIDKIIPTSIAKQRELTLGYRVHLPYVEFKISLKKSLLKPNEEIMNSVDRILDSWIVSKNGADIIHEFAKKLLKFNDFHIFDSASGNRLINRLVESGREIFVNKNWIFANHQLIALAANSASNKGSGKKDTLKTKTSSIGASVDDSTLLFSLVSDKLDTAKAEVKFHEHYEATMISFPYPKMKAVERREQYFAERAILFWNQFLEKRLK